MKKRILWSAGALLLVAMPAVIGLWGNASFAQSVPVRVPTSGQVSSPAPTVAPGPTATPSSSPGVDDHGGDVPRDERTEPGDDRDVQGGTVPAPAPTADDRGGDVPRDERTEPGDDRGGSGGDDHGGDDDSDDHGGHGGDDHGGHGGDD
ncbi:hypothetical protein [Microbacterium sp. 1.5R]|uniref:hypothetical protein n=1 Tax=Microbacterium sp. 1.5R TaxID=1916917 RepID=UPI0011A241AE|nr:hypothetical protein [Microbacterium sp. 1.5R]